MVCGVTGMNLFGVSPAATSGGGNHGFAGLRGSDLAGAESLGSGGRLIQGRALFPAPQFDFHSQQRGAERFALGIGAEGNRAAAAQSLVQ